MASVTRNYARKIENVCLRWPLRDEHAEAQKVVMVMGTPRLRRRYVSNQMSFLRSFVLPSSSSEIVGFSLIAVQVLCYGCRKSAA